MVGCIICIKDPYLLFWHFFKRDFQMPLRRYLILGISKSSICNLFSDGDCLHIYQGSHLGMV